MHNPYKFFQFTAFINYTLRVMTHLLNVFLFQYIDAQIVLIIGVVGFIVGFLLKLGDSRKSSKTLFSLKKDRKVNKDRIQDLQNRIQSLEKKNDILKKDSDKK